MVSPKDQMIKAPIGITFSLIFRIFLMKSDSLIIAFSGTKSTKNTMRQINRIAIISNNRIIINNSPSVANEYILTRLKLRSNLSKKFW